MLFYDRCDFLLPLQRYYWLQRNISQKVPNHLQKLERLIFSLPHVRNWDNILFFSTSLLESCCVKQRMKSARGSVGFFFFFSPPSRHTKYPLCQLDFKDGHYLSWNYPLECLKKRYNKFLPQAQTSLLKQNLGIDYVERLFGGRKVD